MNFTIITYAILSLSSKAYLPALSPCCGEKRKWFTIILYIRFMISAEQQRLIIEKTRPFHPKRIAIFGSYSRGEQTAQSDLDILVDFETKINLFDLIGLEQELSAGK